MIKKVVEADDIKLLRGSEPQTFLGVSKPGGKPSHPIRKRAFWRAWRRKELWAFCAMIDMHMNAGMKAIADQMAKVLYDKYAPPGTVYITWPWDKE